MPDLTLLCPGTLRPAPIADAATPRPRAVGAPAPSAPTEALTVALRRARLLARWHDDSAAPAELPHERWLRDRFGLPADRTVEACTALADGVAPPALRLTPVHLHVARDHLVLTDPTRLALDPDDARALARVAAPVFEEQGLRLASDRADGRWYLQGDTLPALAARAWTLALGRNVDAWSPTGDEARRWRKLVNEIQMLWHIDPVNERRADQGLPVVNGLWLDGASPARLDGPSPFTRVASDDPAIVGLARLAGAQVLAGDHPIERPTTGSVLHVLDAWRRRLRDPEADDGRGMRDEVAAAIARAFESGTDRLTVILAGERSGVSLSLARGDGWKVWQRLDPALLSEARA